MEEIEIMFQKGGPHPWNTSPGHSLLDAKVQELQEHGKAGGVLAGTEERTEDIEKTGTGI